MKSHRFLRVLKIVVIVTVAINVFGYVVMSLWNWLMPAIFGVKPVTFLQALGLLILGKILFGGFHRHSGGWRGRGWKRHMEERWAQMSPEERERLRAGMRGRWGCGFGPASESAPEQKPAV
jgi:hypothetical protein